MVELNDEPNSDHMPSVETRLSPSIKFVCQIW